MQEQIRNGRGCAVKESKTVFTQIRIDEKIFLKGKILAAIYDESFNSFMIRAVQNEIKNYERENGPLPEPKRPEE